MSDYINKLKNILKKRLSRERYEHSLGTMETMIKLAENYSADVKKATLIGLLHDYTKDCSIGQQLKYITKYKIPIQEGEILAPNLHHAITAPVVIKNELGIDDREILSAIRYHTTAKEKMTQLEKMIYVADFIEPQRDYQDVNMYRKLAYLNLDKALFLGLRWNIEKLLKEKDYIHPDSLSAYNSYIIKQIKGENN